MYVIVMVFWIINFARGWFVSDFDAISCNCTEVDFDFGLRFLTQASRARLFKEYKEVQREKAVDPDIQLVCDDSNIFKWTALIKVCELRLVDYNLSVMVLKFALVCFVLFTIRDPLRLLLRVVCSSLPFLFRSSILYSHLKSGFWLKYFTLMCILR